MRVYTDTSFLVRLVTEEPGTEAAMADYHRLGRPAMFYLPLHSLEVVNAVRQRAFQSVFFRQGHPEGWTPNGFLKHALASAGPLQLPNGQPLGERPQLPLATRPQ